MHDLAIGSLLLANRSRLENLSREFQQGLSSDRYGQLVLFLIALGAASLLFWGLAHWMERRHGLFANRPMGLFFSLSKAHALSWSDRWLLWQLARSHRLRAPARLFLEPERFEASRLPPAMRRHVARLEGLRQRLFTGLAEAEEEISASQGSPCASRPGPPQ
jgi:hypothetical protein